MQADESFNLPELIVGCVTLTVFFGSLLLWLIWSVRKFRQPAALPELPLRPWAIGWLNFGIFICGLIGLIFVVQSVVWIFYGLIPDSKSSEVWTMVFGALTLQSSFLIGYYSCRRYFPMLFKGNLSSHEMGAGRALLSAIPFFIRTLPLVGLIAFLWTTLLNWIVANQWLDSIQPQEAVLVFANSQSPVALTLLAFFAIILAPIAEEVIFRGCIYRFLKSKLRPQAAMLLSAIVFGSIHGNLMAFVPLTFVGFLLAYTYEKERNLLVPIFYHGLFNLFTLSMTILHVLSGNELPY
ncbi:MAG: CPBP family intramembrane glutamic endopeptidase [Coraliomargaritaceae bacterium]